MAKIVNIDGLDKLIQGFMAAYTKVLSGYQEGARELGKLVVQMNDRYPGYEKPLLAKCQGLPMLDSNLLAKLYNIGKGAPPWTLFDSSLFAERVEKLPLAKAEEIFVDGGIHSVEIDQDGKSKPRFYAIDELRKSPKLSSTLIDVKKAKSAQIRSKSSVAEILRGETKPRPLVTTPVNWWCLDTEGNRLKPTEWARAHQIQFAPSFKATLNGLEAIIARVRSAGQSSAPSKKDAKELASAMQSRQIRAAA